MRRPSGFFSRETEKKQQFITPTWAEVRKVLFIAVADLDEYLRDIPVDGDKNLRPAHLVNAVLIWFLSRPRSEQIEIARQGRKASEWLRTQSVITGFQRFDMEAIEQAWERLKNGGQPRLQIGVDDASQHHAITDDDNKNRFELKGEQGIDPAREPRYKKGRNVTQKARQPRRKGIA